MCPKLQSDLVLQISKATILPSPSSFVSCNCISHFQFFQCMSKMTGSRSAALQQITNPSDRFRANWLPYHNIILTSLGGFAWVLWIQGFLLIMKFTLRCENCPHHYNVSKLNRSCELICLKPIFDFKKPQYNQERGIHIETAEVFN